VSFNLKGIEHQCPCLNLSKDANDPFEEDALMDMFFVQPFSNLSCDDSVARRVCQLASGCPSSPQLARFESAFGVSEITEDLTSSSRAFPISGRTLLTGVLGASEQCQRLGSAKCPHQRHDVFPSGFFSFAQAVSDHHRDGVL
jgi:hypothetical protein